MEHLDSQRSWVLWASMCQLPTLQSFVSCCPSGSTSREQGNSINIVTDPAFAFLSGFLLPFLFVWLICFVLFQFLGFSPFFQMRYAFKRDAEFYQLYCWKQKCFHLLLNQTLAFPTDLKLLSENSAQDAFLLNPTASFLGVASLRAFISLLTSPCH